MAVITGTILDELLSGDMNGVERDTIQGSGGADTLFGLGENDALFGHVLASPADGAPDDLHGGVGADIIHIHDGDEGYGEAGNDLLIAASALPPAVIDGGAGNDTLLMLDTRAITGATVTGVERLIADDGSIGARLTADQLGQFNSIEPISGQTGVHLRLTGGGSAIINPTSALLALRIDGSTQSEILDLVASSNTALNYFGSGLGDASVGGGVAGDSLRGGGGADTLAGRAGDDTLFGNTEFSPADVAVDILRGGAGADILHIHDGDEGFGEAGNDLIIAASALPPAVIDGGAGNDTLLMLDTRAITGAIVTSLERLVADDGSIGARLTADQLGQFNSLEPISGQTGVHLRLTGGGSAVINPTAALLALRIDGSSQSESFDLVARSNTALSYFGSGVGDASVGGGTAGDRLQGGGGADTLLGRAGDDQLFGHLASSTADARADELVGGNGNDSLYASYLDQAYGNGGGDLFIVTAGPSPTILNGGAGADTLRIDKGDISGTTIANLERLEAGGGLDQEARLTARQLAAFDIVASFGGDDTAFLRLTAGGLASGIKTDDSLASLEILGSNQRDGLSLSSSSSASLVVDGFGGADILRGGKSSDALRGGSGDDLLEGGALDDLLDGGAGSDTAWYAFANGGVRVDLGQSGAQNTEGDGVDTLVAIENVIGSRFADSLSGGAGGNLIEGGEDNGGAGADTLNGRGGQDTVSYRMAEAAIDLDLALTAVQNTGGGGEDRIRSFENVIGSGYDDGITGNGDGNRLFGGAGGDVLEGRAGNDRLDGDDGADTLFGSTGDDTLDGGEQDDELWGNAGSDRLTGGGGADVFAVRAGGGTETVTDFEDGMDRLLFRNFGPAFDTPAEILARASEVGDDVHIPLPNSSGGNTRMIVLDLLLADLGAGDLLF